MHPNTTKPSSTRRLPACWPVCARYDHAEGGLADVLQLDILLRALQFSQAKADSQVGWGGGEAVGGATALVVLLELSGAGGTFLNPLGSCNICHSAFERGG